MEAKRRVAARFHVSLDPFAVGRFFAIGYFSPKSLKSFGLLLAIFSFGSDGANGSLPSNNAGRSTWVSALANVISRGDCVAILEQAKSPPKGRLFKLMLK
jgi:hypothetical protein